MGLGLALTCLVFVFLPWDFSRPLKKTSFVPRSLDSDVGGLGFHEQMLQMNGSVDWEGLSALRQEMKGALKTGSLGVLKMNGSNAAPDWNEMGPSSTSGRTRAVVVWSGDSLLAGGVSGGLWQSLNRGGTWMPVTSFPSQMTASIAVAGNGDLYVGTGTAWEGGGGEGGSGFRGEGIYRSTDSGASWELVTGSINFDATDALEPDPVVENRVWFASTSGYGSITDGALVEVPGGTNAPSVASDVAIAPDGSYCLVAGVNGRVYRSVNGDFSDFVLISQGNGSTGNPPQSGIGRARLDIALMPNENGTYNAFAVYATSGGYFYGLFFSGDAGVAGSWENVWPGEINYLTPLPRNQGMYDLALGIAPDNPRLAYVGGIELWRAGPEQQAQPAAVPYDVPGADYAMHPDVHEILSSEDGTMYFGTDGGLYRSDDAGLTFLEVNGGYNVSQFYALAMGPGGEVLGGTQDNGSLLMTPSKSTAETVLGGDGFDCTMSQRRDVADSTLGWVATSQYGKVARGRSGPTNSTINSFLNSAGVFDDFYFDSDGDGLANDLGQFYTCIGAYEDDTEPNQDLLVLGLRDYNNQNLGVWILRNPWNAQVLPQWIRVADAPSGFSGTKAIEFVAQGEEAGDVMFFTGWNGQVTRVSGLRDVYSQEDVDNGVLEVVNILGPTGTAVTGLSVDPNDPNHVVISLGGYGSSSLGKVRETFNALAEDVAWTNIWDSELASLPCYDVLIDVQDASGATIYVGTEFGLFVTENGGEDWFFNNDGMAGAPDQLFTPIFDLKQQVRQGANWPDVTNYGEIYLATHGRGVYTTQQLRGCTDSAACNFWRGANLDDASCEYTSCTGCGDLMACNYNPAATQEIDCDYSCYGCTDVMAVNYNASALLDDGSCVSAFQSCDQLLAQDWALSGLGWWPNDTIQWAAGTTQTVLTAFFLPANLSEGETQYNTDSFVVTAVEGLPPGVNLESPPVGAGEAGCWPLQGLAQSQGTYDVVVTGEVLVQVFGSLFPIPLSFSAVIQVQSPDSLLGCTYATAVNFNALAAAEDGSCVFGGCTDSLAVNYSPAFGESDASCIYDLANLNCPEDLNLDNQVNTSDLLVFLGAYGQNCD